MVTFVDPRHVRPTKVRGRDVFGWTYLEAGFREDGRTKKEGLLALRLFPEDFPPVCAPLGLQAALL